MATIFNTVAVGYTYFSSISIAVVNPSIFDVDHLTRGTKNIAAVLDVAPYNQGYTAAHLALVMHRTGNVMLTTHQEFGPYIYTQNSTIPTRWRCALKALTYVMCPTYSADPDCPCINITQDIRMATVMHGSPRLRLTSFTTEAGMTSYLDGLGQPPQWDYYYPSSVGIPSEIANAMNTLLQSKPDVMITTVYYPEMAAVLRASGSLARHLITFNAGWSTVWPSFGSELFVGQDEYEAGYLVGAELRRRGVHANVVCLLEFDATKIEPRCEGVQAGLTPDGFMTKLYMATSVTQQAREFLSTTFGATITAWVSTSASSAVASSVAFRELGVTIPLFAFDISSAMMPLLDSEDIVLTIEQQSHLQGYMAVMHGVLSALTEQPVQTRFLRTGPVVVTRANMSTYYCESSGYRTCGPNDIIVPVSMLNNRGDIIVIDNRLNLVLFIASIGVLAFGIVLSVSITCQVDIQRVTLLQDVPSVNILFTGTVSSSLDRNLELSPRSPTTSKRLKGWMQGQQLGHGSYGVVYLALCSDGSFMAVKSIELLNGTTEAALNAMISEMQLMRSIPRHPHIVQYYGCEVDRIQRRLNILMEYVPGGSLGALARGLDVPFQESVVRRYTHQILLGLQYLHSLNIIHRDIKGDNILLTEGIVKLADFGTAKRFEEMGTTKGTISVAGTPLWMAPEVLTGAGNRRTDKKYDTKADIWSVGCTVVEMLNKGKPPWRNFSSLYEAVYTIGRSTGLPTGIPDGLSGECLRFLERCFERDVEKRADVDELLQHPFVNEEEPEGESPRGRVNVTLLNDVIATPTDRSGVPPISWSDSLGKSIHESV
jgi:serine/threonine protein kinase